MNLSCDLHKLPPLGILAGNDAAVVKCHRRKIMVNCGDGVKFVAVCYDREKFVPPIKAHEQAEKKRQK